MTSAKPHRSRPAGDNHRYGCYFDSVISQVPFFDGTSVRPTGAG